MDYVVRIVTTAEVPTAVIAKATRWEDFPEVWRPLLGEVWTFLRGSGLTTGRNIMLYKDDLPNVEIGAEVSSLFEAVGRVVPSSLPAGRAAATVEYGPPSPAGLARAHAAVKDWCATNGYVLTETRWEIYGHSLEDQDPAMFETEIYWLVQSGPSS